MSGTTGQVPLQAAIADQLITSALWNAEFANVGTLLDAAGCGGHSDTDSDAQIQTAPYPGSVLSKATSIAGELERIRYQIAAMIGKNYWYQPPDNDLTSFGFTPIGGVMDYPVATPPSAGWHLADGTAISRAGYPTLFALIGTTFGSGDTTTTFNLPDYRDRMSIGAGSSYAVAATGGSVTAAAHSHTVNSHTHDLSSHTHDLANHVHAGPSHTHTIATGNFNNGTNATLTFIATNTTGASGTANTAGPSVNTSGTPSSNASGATSPGTDSQSPNVLNPYLAMYKMIRVL
jgi:microcystin-dependent protein